jgi:primosomal protein N' (replication factor Y)
VEIFEQDDKKTRFAELLLPVPIPKLFTYRVPVQLNDYALPGIRAIVQFGDRRIMTGIIVSVHDQPPKDYEAKYILDLLDQLPTVNDVQLKLFQWIAAYYACTTGEVMNAALPAGLKLSSESMVQLNPSFNIEETDLPFSEKEWTLLKRLGQESMTYSEISKFLGVKHIHAILKSLAGKEAIILFEEVKDTYRPKTERRIRLTKDHATSDQLERLFTTLGSKPKQEAVLLARRSIYSNHHAGAGIAPGGSDRHIHGAPRNLPGHRSASRRRKRR